VFVKPFDASGAFHPSVRDGEVRRLAIRGASVTVFSGGLGLAVQVIGTVILVRLLTPADFGVVTMVTTFSLLLANFGLNGFTEAILQWKEIDRYLVSNLFWINVCAGLVLAAGFAATGSLMAWFYHDALVARVAAGISLTIFFTSTSVQHLALLKRAMRFSVTSVNEIFSRGVSLALSLVLAWAGWGYWALVLGAVAQSLIQSVGAWFLCRWVPSLPRRVPGTASMVKFAINVYGRFTVNYFARNVDNLLVGWRFGAIPLGFYKKAYDLFALSVGQLTAPLTNVAVAALSRFDPHSPKYRQNLLGAISLLAFVGMGLSAEFTVVGKDLIYLLLGPKWGPAGQIFTFFAPGIGMMLIYYTNGWIHLSIGRADRWFRWGLVEVGITCLLFVLALPWGPKGVAVAWASSFWILTIPALWYAGKPIDFGIAQVLANVWKFVVAALLAGGASTVISREIPFLSVALGSPEKMAAAIVRASLVLVALYLGTVILLYRGCAPLYQLGGLARELISLRKSSALALEAVASTTGEAMVTIVSRNSRSRPLVSILIPAFNAEEWIADTLKSAIGQTWDRTEIIVVDDGSTDQTVAIARQFESDRVHVVTQKNQGAAAARNKAFSLCRGDYIQWLDADDLLAPDKIAKQVEVLDNSGSNRTLLSSSFGRFKYRRDRAEFAPTALWCDLSPTEWLVRKLAQNAYMQTATWLVSRELTEAAGPWDTALLGDDDGEYFCRVLLASDGARFVSDSKIYYRSPWVGTLSYIGRSERKLNAHWRSMRLHIGYLRALEDSDRVRAACLAYLQRNFIYFYPEKPEIISQFEELARELGGKLQPPCLSWKYAWIQVAFGWGPAKRCETLLPEVRWLVEKTWDKALFRLRGRISSNEL
jgi:O-antigen/teichoic acid export membrane protein/glycosyltransferase involved in cell wall biosynthesis